MKFDNIMSKVVTPTKAESAFVISSFASSSDAVTQIQIDMLVPFEGQPFKPYSQEKLMELVEDIKINGILSPVIVRIMADGKYQILAGHNRTNAGRLAGLTTVPCIIKQCDDNEAMLIVVNTNLNQRQELLPSEKAFAYKMQLEAMKRQAGRPKDNSCQVGTDLIGTRSDSQIAENSSDSARQIQRYIRLTYLITTFLNMVDDNKLAFMVGVNLSFISESNQTVLYQFALENKTKISLKQAEELKGFNNDFTFEILFDYFYPEREDETPKAKVVAVKLTKAQYKTVAMCIKSQKHCLDPQTYNTLIFLFDNN